MSRKDPIGPNRLRGNLVLEGSVMRHRLLTVSREEDRKRRDADSESAKLGLGKVLYRSGESLSLSLFSSDLGGDESII